MTEAAAPWTGTGRKKGTPRCPAGLHVEQARRASDEQPAAPLASATVGDARRLDRPDASVDAALLLGPLYHLTERGDRVAALAEARRVLRPGGVLAAIRRVEAEPSLLGASAHLLAIAQRPS